MTNDEHYERLSIQLEHHDRTDLYLAEQEPEVWATARTIDDWLVTYREDARVSEEQYARNCAKLLDLYRHAEIAQRAWDARMDTMRAVVAVRDFVEEI